ncbi:extracellular solute-binding protein [Christensenellaceae bacterium OttesenSCG-928-K19]|nr:extracellular solute-binding protein [Christensenellaceae bacterium OttesenSCG-928-K19]
MKKWICLAMVMVMVCAALVACSVPATPSGGTDETAETPAAEQPSDDGEETEDPPAQSGGDVSINFITWRAEDADVLKEMVAMFEEQNPGIKVNLEITSSDMTEYYTILKSRLVSGEGADIFHCHPGAYLDQLVEAGYCKDLTDTGLGELYDEEFYDIGVINNKLYGLVQTYNSFAVFYNTKLFDELGLQKPSSYADVLAAAQASTDAGYMPIAAGFAEAWTTGMVYEQLMANYSPDDDMVFKKLEDGEYKLSEEPYLSVLNDIAQMNTDGLFQKNAMGTKYDASLSLFARGEATMLITGTWSVGGLKDMDESLEFGLFSLPGVNAEAVGIVSPSQLICVNDKSSATDAAMKFAEFLSSVEAETFYSNNTKQAPTVKGVEVDVAELAEVSKLMEGKTAVLSDTYIKDPVMVSIMDEVAAKILGGQDVQSAAAEGQAQIDALIAENNG